MTADQFYNIVVDDFFLFAHSVSLFLGFIFGVLYWKEVFK